MSPGAPRFLLVAFLFLGIENIISLCKKMDLADDLLEGRQKQLVADIQTAG